MEALESFLESNDVVVAIDSSMPLCRLLSIQGSLGVSCWLLSPTKEIDMFGTDGLETAGDAHS